MDCKCVSVASPRLHILAASLLIVILAAGCALDGPQSTLYVSGPVAKMQARVFWISLMVCLGVFAATGGLLLYAVWRFRAKAGQADVPCVQTHGNVKLEFALSGLFSHPSCPHQSAAWRATRGRGA